ncbi:MAG TPA: TonB-dependent receptor [Bryobacteraceae bacterium]|nr:TonB-dependent receptor [Bryobacteraceae bacterium]
MKRNQTRSSFAILCWLLLTAFPALAQDRGTITGTVTDPTGAAVQDAVVTARNTNTGLTQTAKSGHDGSYSLLYLPVGSYVVSAEKAGFRKAEAANVPVNVNTVARLDIQLTVGAVEQTIEVTAAAPLLEANQGTNLGKVVPTKAIMDLPLFIGGGGVRSTMAFVILTPGVIGGEGNPRIGGGLLDGQSERLDGAEAQSERRNDPAMRGASIEALEEFKVQTGAYSAEYGRTSNGVINFVTKSGSNELHGSGFLFLRNEFFNARGRTFTPTERPRARQWNPGGSIGGPVYIPRIFDGRNKAFFFFAYEYAYQNNGRSTGLVTLPINEFRIGDMRRLVDASGRQIPLYDPFDSSGNIITDAFARSRLQCNGVLNVICPERIDAIARASIALLPPVDNNSLLTNNTRSFSKGIAKQWVPSIKGDYVFSEKNRMNFFYSLWRSPAQANFGAQGVPSSGWANEQKIQYYRVNHDYVFRPNLLNHLILGLNKRHIIENPDNMNMIPEEWRIATAVRGTVAGTKPGKSSRYNTGIVDFGTHVDTDSRQRTTTIYEQVAWLKGKHSFKFGFEHLRGIYRRLDYNDATGTVDFSAAGTGNPGVSGQTGHAWASFLLGTASGGRFRYPSDTAFQFPYYAWYVQDDVKLTHKLTLNIGLRYDLPIPKEEREHGNSNFNPSLPNPGAGGLLGAMEFAGSGPGRSGKDRFGETRKNAFGPRLGIAYMLTPQTVIRAGGSIYYQPTREDGNADNGIQGFGGIFGAPGNFLANGIAFRTRDGLLPFGADVRRNMPPVIDPTIQLFGTPFYYFPKAGRAPYFTDYQFTIERGVGTNALARVTYHANLGNKLLARITALNQLDPKYWAIYGTLLGRRLDDPQVIARGVPLPYAGYPTNRQLQQALRPYPQYGGIDSNAGGMNDGHMTFHALESSFEHRFSGGLYMLASYTFCKLIANTEGEDANRGDTPAAQNHYNRRLEKAVGAEDTPHNLRLSYVYELPFGRGRKWLGGVHPIANAVLGNWRVSGIHTYVSGRPLRVTSGQNFFGAGQSARASFVPGQPLINPAWSDDPAVAWSVPYLNRAAFRRPADMEYGDTPRRMDYLRGPGTVQEDFAILKNFHVTERNYFEIRAAARNALNRARLAGPNTNFDSVDFGRITSAQGNSPREIQFGLKFYF